MVEDTGLERYVVNLGAFLTSAGVSTRHSLLGVVRGCSWLFVVACGCSWLFVVVRGCSWLFVAYHELVSGSHLDTFITNTSFPQETFWSDRQGREIKRQSSLMHSCWNPSKNVWIGREWTARVDYVVIVSTKRLMLVCVLQ